MRIRKKATASVSASVDITVLSQELLTELMKDKSDPTTLDEILCEIEDNIDVIRYCIKKG